MQWTAYQSIAFESWQLALSLVSSTVASYVNVGIRLLLSYAKTVFTCGSLSPPVPRLLDGRHRMRRRLCWLLLLTGRQSASAVYPLPWSIGCVNEAALPPRVRIRVSQQFWYKRFGIREINFRWVPPKLKATRDRRKAIFRSSSPPVERNHSIRIMEYACLLTEEYLFRVLLHNFEGLPTQRSEDTLWRQHRAGACNTRVPRVGKPTLSIRIPLVGLSNMFSEEPKMTHGGSPRGWRVSKLSSVDAGLPTGLTAAKRFPSPWWPCLR